MSGNHGNHRGCPGHRGSSMEPITMEGALRGAGLAEAAPFLTGKLSGTPISHFPHFTTHPHFTHDSPPLHTS